MTSESADRAVVTPVTGSASPLFASQRQEWILRELAAAGRIEQSAVARALEVSGETIRKDLTVLERQGLLQRVHGGAVLLASLTVEPPVEARTQFRSQKLAIARAALAYLPEAGGTVFLDAGSTVSLVADLLPGDVPITVYTNALVIAASLTDRKLIEVRTVGGRLRRPTMAVVGGTAVSMLRGINVDVAFLGTNGVSLERGLTTPDPEEAEVKAAMARCAQRRVVLADSSKFGRISQCQHCDLADVDVLITDDAAPVDMITALSDRQIEVDLGEELPA